VQVQVQALELALVQVMELALELEPVLALELAQVLHNQQQPNQSPQ